MEIEDTFFRSGTQLAEELDKKLLIQLRDGRKILGILRSFDQFANLVLEGAVERIFVGEQYGDIPLGLQLIRGENVVLLGEVDPACEVPPGLTQVSAAEIRQAQKAEKELNKLKATIRWGGMQLSVHEEGCACCTRHTMLPGQQTCLFLHVTCTRPARLQPLRPSLHV